jgi:hypothetical protein
MDEYAELDGVTVDVREVMARVSMDEPLEDIDRHAIMASLLLWMLVPEHTRMALLEAHVAECSHPEVPTSDAIN